jgi:hypothetical protein
LPAAEADISVFYNIFATKFLFLRSEVYLAAQKANLQAAMA